MKKVLVVEDDVCLGTTLAGGLEMKRMNVCYSDGKNDVFELFEQFRPDIVLLDVLMGDEKAGFDIARHIRATYNTPIIFITALDSPQDLNKAFSFENIDYVSKPFNFLEVFLRITRMLSNTSRFNFIDRYFQIGSYTFYPEMNSLEFSNESVHLNNFETGVLNVLCRKINTFVSKSEIISTVWGVDDYKMKEGSLNNTISSLRKRFAKEPRIKIIALIKVGVKLSMEL